ncbi:hypothetical protein SAMN05421874_12454 [Nonomuraea maritima]|uniref:Uncharacterized protein n=1 Tax=Nonomuraea maritima TaxID=683260 RepID=A0A1G9L7U4_9ACTN|nr:hypothetical protein [Nonomuraea maritima]SDL57817.1 hypothetical protein SAMN05421874_12454 [Nonomuraea maritima]
MSVQKIGSIVAAAVLTAGVSWWSTAPAGAGSCVNAESALLSHTAFASYCDLASHAGRSIHGSSRMATDESAQLAMAAGELAQELGLTGLAAPKPVLGSADLGGTAATWGMPALNAASPAVLPMTPALQDVSTAPSVPALPVLPQTPDLARRTPPAKQRLAGQVGRPQVPGSPVKVNHNVAEPVHDMGKDVAGALLEKGGKTSGLPEVTQGLGTR